MNNLKKYSMLAALGLGMVGMSGTASQARGIMSDLEFSKDIGVFSQYVWRGTAQGNGVSSVQSDINVEHNSGAFANVWAASGVSPTPGANGEVTEFDITLGYAGETKRIGYSGGLILYRYHNNGAANAAEIFGGVTYNMGRADLYYNLDSKNVWVDLGADFDLADFSVDSTLSFNAPDKGTSEFVNLAVGISKEVEIGRTAMTTSFQYNYHMGVYSDTAVGNNLYAPDSIVFGVNFAY